MWSKYFISIEEDDYLVPGDFPLECPSCGQLTSADCVEYLAVDDGYGMCDSYTRCPDCRKRITTWNFVNNIGTLWDELGDEEFRELVKAGISARYKHKSIFEYGEKR